MASPVRANRINDHVWLIVTLAGAALMAALTILVTPPPMMSDDSPSYLNWSVVRTPGYPLFLSIVRVVDPDLAHLPFIQMAILIASAAFLAQAAARLGGARWIWLLMGAGILGNPFIWRYAWQVLTESLFITLVMIFLGCIAMALQAHSTGLRWLFGASVALGAAILVRPVGYALLGVATLIGLLWYGRRWAAVCAATVPAIAMLLAVSSWNLVTKGYFATQLFTGYNIGKYDHTLPIPYTADPATLGQPSSVTEAKQNQAYSVSIAFATIRHHPADYIERVLTNFTEMWTFPDISTAETARIRMPGFAVLLKDGLFSGLMAFSFVLVIAVAMAPAASQLLVFAAVAALCVNANHLLVALIESALPRYAMAMWPVLLAMIAAFAAWLTVWRAGRHASRRQSDGA